MQLPTVVHSPPLQLLQPLQHSQVRGIDTCNWQVQFRKFDHGTASKRYQFFSLCSSMSNLAPRTSVNKSTQPISTRRDWDTPCDNCGIPPKYLNTEYCSCPGSPKPSVGTLTAGFYIDLHESTAKLFESIGACAKAYHRTVDSLHQISRGQIKIFGPNGVVYIFYDAFIRAYPEASGIELRSTVRPDRPGLLEFVKVTLKSQKAKGRWRTAKKANLG